MTVPFFQWTYTGVAAVAVILVVGLVLMLSEKSPSVSSVRQAVAILNDKGGVILVLTSLTVYFFVTAIRMFFYAIELVANKRLDADNALVLMGLQFVTGVAFGGSFGALLKTFTGVDVPMPPMSGDPKVTTISVSPSQGSTIRTDTHTDTHTAAEKPEAAEGQV